MTRQVVAALNLDARESAVLDAALLYYADTMPSEDDDDDDRQRYALAERVRLRLRKSVERHGYVFRAE